MKVNILTTSFKSCLWYSGISNAAFLLARGLNNKYGADVKIFAPHDGGPKKEKHKNFSVERFSTIDIRKLCGYSVSTEAFGMLGKEKPDLIHSFHYGYFPATIGFIAAKKKQVPHIFTTAYHPPSSALKKKIFKLYNISQGAHIIKHSDAVLPFNKNEKNELSKIAKGKFKIVPCPIDHKIYKPRQLKSGKLTVAFVGPMELWKGPLVAFGIFKEIEKERNDVNFVFVGNGTLAHQIDLYRDLKAKAGKRFTFTRNLSPEKLSGVYNRADVLVAPTFYESFGCTIAESMMCGTPVVSTSVGAVPETIGNGGLLVKYGDWSGMKDNINRLLDNTRLRKKMSKNAIRHSEQYRDDVVVKKIHDIYKNVLI